MNSTSRINVRLLMNKRFWQVSTWPTLFFVTFHLIMIPEIYNGVRLWANQLDPEDSAYELTSDAHMLQLAEDLDFSALRIFEWVRREVKYEPYIGSMKGALGAYHSRKGNDVDQALLLIQLLELANKKWRLCVADAKLSAVDTRDWLRAGTTTAALEVLSRANILYSVDDANHPNWVTLKDHVFVEAWADYFPARGAAADDRTTGTALPQNADAPDRWVPLDPAVTLTENLSSANVSDLSGADSADTLAYVQSQLTKTHNDKAVKSLPDSMLENRAEVVGQSLKGWLDANNKTIEEHLNTPGSPLLAERQGLPATYCMNCPTVFPNILKTMSWINWAST